MKIIEMDISEVIPYANNPRDNSKAVDAVAASIREFGFKVPVVIDRNNILITGHTRLEAARKLGIQKIPAIRAADLTEAQVKAYRLADNKVSEIATWDDGLLAGELQALDDLNFDMGPFGFSEDDLGDNIDDIADPEVPEDPDPITQPGDLFQLGDHRLLCGDSARPEDIARLTEGQETDLILTDPPYNVAYEGKNAALTIENDSMSSDEYIDFLTRTLQAASDTLKKGGGLLHFLSELVHIRGNNRPARHPGIAAQANVDLGQESNCIRPAGLPVAA